METSMIRCIVNMHDSTLSDVFNFHFSLCRFGDAGLSSFRCSGFQCQANSCRINERWQTWFICTSPRIPRTQQTEIEPRIDRRAVLKKGGGSVNSSVSQGTPLTHYFLNLIKSKTRWSHDFLENSARLKRFKNAHASNVHSEHEGVWDHPIDAPQLSNRWAQHSLNVMGRSESNRKVAWHQRD